MRDLQDLILDDRQDLAWCNACEVGGNRVEQTGDRNEADDGDEEQESREECKTEVVRELRREAKSASTSLNVRRASSDQETGTLSARSITGPAAGR